MKVALVTVASASYQGFARDLMESAREHFLPGQPVSLAILPGVEGWPAGTECRHGLFADWLADHDQIDVAYLCDADMRFAADVSAVEVLPPRPGIVATLHPGYIGAPRARLPYEGRSGSTARVPPGRGERYFCGGFVGGTRHAMIAFSHRVDGMIHAERRVGRSLIWHDESAVNAILVAEPPVWTLDPRFCCPADADYYRDEVWGIDYSEDARLVALDKTAAQRVGR